MREKKINDRWFEKRERKGDKYVSGRVRMSDKALNVSKKGWTAGKAVVVTRKSEKTALQA